MSWQSQLDSYLANDFRLIAIDNRGHGRSEKPENADDIIKDMEKELLSDKLMAELEELYKNDFGLVGEGHLGY